MKTKACFKCLEQKSIEQFYAHVRMPDGYLNKCKDCAKADALALYKQHMQDPAWVARERVRTRNRNAKLRAAGKKSKQTYENARAWIDRHPMKRRAHGMARNALLRGRIVRADACQDCGQRAPLDMHHPDYSRPLDVVWVCKPCHGIRHRKPNLIAA